MKTERLPEIVEAVKVTRMSDTWRETLILTKGRSGEPYYAWRCVGPQGDTYLNHTVPHDAANACVVAMLGRLVANQAWALVQDDRITINSEYIPEYDGIGFPGDLLNALYDAFLSHPDWFKEQA
jgi:hypothetical protein